MSEAKNHAEVLRMTKETEFQFISLSIVAWVISLLILVLSCLKIDFHADESIYFSGIPVNVSNDNGLVFHAVYQLFGLIRPTPESARWVSFGFGCILIAAVMRIMWRLLPQDRRWLTAFLPLVIVVSYQGVFTILRVRPEISWLSLTAVSLAFMVEYRVCRRPVFRLFFLLTLVLLPMNHQLSYFPAALILLYLFCFSRAWLGWRWLAMSMIAVGLGVILNSLIRHWIVDGSFHLIPAVNSAPREPLAKLTEFLKSVFWSAPHFLNDRAAYPSWWNMLGFSHAEQDGLHCLISTWLWAACLLLPGMFKTWESRFVAATPILILAAFYVARYYNPTYAPLPTILGSVLFFFVLVSNASNRWCWRRYVAGVVIVISLFNGASFLSTRVLDHGAATFFAIEEEIRNQLRRLPEKSVVAVSERFRTAVPTSITAKVIFKEPLGQHVDFVVVDQYDFEMYRFVPEYEQRRSEIEDVINEGSVVTVYRQPVYAQDRLLPDVVGKQSSASVQGSWFFRHGVENHVSCIIPLKPVSP